MRRHSKKPKNVEIVVETINAVANNMTRLVDAYEKSKPYVNYSDLYKAVMNVEALDIDSRMTAFEYLNADLVKTRAFLMGGFDVERGTEQPAPSALADGGLSSWHLAEVVAVEESTGPSRMGGL
ncbi:unnamed protein product [Ilex paraguariensis]|uniref:Uncharacterized protein n=1 Tax=Ilex paraguariensis TaxID=185542 RepID=A0ABC8U8T2_9AQUA